MDHPIMKVRPEAAALLRQRLAAAGIADGGLRVGFLYGCGGAGYRLSLAAAELPGDQTVWDRGVRIFVDAVAAESLAGAELAIADGELTLDHPAAVMIEYCG